MTVHKMGEFRGISVTVHKMCESTASGSAELVISCRSADRGESLNDAGCGPRSTAGVTKPSRVRRRMPEPLTDAADQSADGPPGTRSRWRDDLAGGRRVRASDIECTVTEFRLSPYFPVPSTLDLEQVPAKHTRGATVVSSDRPLLIVISTLRCVDTQHQYLAV